VSNQLGERVQAATSNGCLFRTHRNPAAVVYGDDSRFLAPGTPSLPRKNRTWQVLSSTSDTLDDPYSLFITNPAILGFVDLDEPIRVEFFPVGTQPTSRMIDGIALSEFLGIPPHVIGMALVELPESVVANEQAASQLLSGPAPSGLTREGELATYALADEGTGGNGDPHDALDAIAKWTRLSPDDLGSLWGASRRSIYNWLDAKPIKSAEIADWIVQTYSALMPLQGTRDPFYFRKWLADGDPSPTALIQSRQWRDLRERVHAEVTPLLPVEPSARLAAEEPVGYGDEVLRAISHALRTVTPVASVVRSAWIPRESTGLGEDEDEEGV
jgi:hypothetical protein